MNNEKYFRNRMQRFCNDLRIPCESSTFSLFSVKFHKLILCHLPIFTGRSTITGVKQGCPSLHMRTASK